MITLYPCTCSTSQSGIFLVSFYTDKILYFLQKVVNYMFRKCVCSLQLKNSTIYFFVRLFVKKVIILFQANGSTDLDKETNQPHIIALQDEDLPTTYSIGVEQVVHLSTDNVDKAVFVAFALHYVYDMQYHPKLKDFYLFLETISFSSDLVSVKPSAVFSSFMSALQCYVS